MTLIELQLKILALQGIDNISQIHHLVRDGVIFSIDKKVFEALPHPVWNSVKGSLSDYVQSKVKEYDFR